MNTASFEFNLFGEKTYIVWDESTLEAAVIDPGMSNEAECERFDNFINKNGLKLKYLLYTHLHIDHTFGHEFIQTTYGLEAYANVGDAALGEIRNEQAQMFHLPVKRLSTIEIKYPIADGDVITLGNDSLLVISVPGHTQGSVAYYSKSGKMVFTGDALFNGSIGRTDLPGGNGRQLIESIRNQLLTLPPDTIVYPGHGPRTTIGKEATTNPFL